MWAYAQRTTTSTAQEVPRTELAAIRDLAAASSAEAPNAGTSRDEAMRRTADLAGNIRSARCARDVARREHSRAVHDLKDAKSTAFVAANCSFVARDRVAATEDVSNTTRADAASTSTALSRLEPVLAVAVATVLRQDGATFGTPPAVYRVVRCFESLRLKPDADALSAARASVDAVVEELGVLVN